MKKTIFFLMLILPLSYSAFASGNCFIAKENNHVIDQQGDCDTRHPPNSTFKIAISLMGYDDGILLDETHPELPFKDGYTEVLEAWKQPQNPSSWMKTSCVWYSQVVVEKLGLNKFSDYVSKLNYGNKDVSGDKGKNNALTSSWISSSLRVSPTEQIEFLQKLINDELPVSKKSQEMTKNILFVGELSNGWKIYGKTGTGNLVNVDGISHKDLQFGWFVGWLSKGNRTITFVNYLEDKEKQDNLAGPRAKKDAKEKLLSLVR